MTAGEKSDQEQELPLEALILQAQKDRYKIGYAAFRWAKEIKQSENLPDPISFLIPRALREILTNKKKISEVEKLPMSIRITPPPPPTITPNAPTLKVVPQEEDKKEEPVKAEPVKEEPVKTPEKDKKDA